MKARRPRHAKRSRGAILPLTAIALVGLCGFVALAVDVGMLAIARAQAQDAADAAAVAGARSLNGSTGSNLTGATANATSQATRNTILGTQIGSSEVAVQHGTYHYNYTSQTFYPEFPPGANENYNLSQVTINHTFTTTFGAVLGMPTMNVTVTSTAAHRPRDVAMVLDYSGSMNNETDLWNCETYLGSYYNTPNNTDPIFPQWGPYNPSVFAVGDDAMHDQQSDGRDVQCHDVGQRRAGPRDEFLPECSRPDGSVGLFRRSFGGHRYHADRRPIPQQEELVDLAINWSQITGSTTTAFTGYAAQQGGTFYGYQQGPGYWGKTFFIWPPDPAAANDWRKKFFENPNGTVCNDDTALYDSSGNWLQPQRKLHYQLQSDPELDRQHRAQPVPAGASRGEHPVLFVDPD